MYCITLHCIISYPPRPLASWRVDASFLSILSSLIIAYQSYQPSPTPPWPSAAGLFVPCRSSEPLGVFKSYVFLQSNWTWALQGSSSAPPWPQGLPTWPQEPILAHPGTTLVHLGVTLVHFGIPFVPLGPLLGPLRAPWCLPATPWCSPGTPWCPYGAPW